MFIAFLKLIVLQIKYRGIKILALKENSLAGVFNEAFIDVRTSKS